MPFVYEINGQRVEFDSEPTEADIDEAAKNLAQPQGASELFTAPPQPQDYAIPQAAMSAARPAAEAARGAVGMGMDIGRNVADIGRNMMNWSPAAWKEVISHPVSTAKAYIGSHPLLSQGVGGMARGVGGALAAPLTAPENLFTAPYTMAAYEQDKIRQNPQAPGLESNPFAQQLRGEYPTQGAAAAANRRQAIRSQTYGGLTADEQSMLKADRELSYAIRLKAARKVLGQE